MPAEIVENLFEEAENDESLGDDLFGAESVDETRNVAADAGYDVTIEELEEVRDAIQAAQDSEAELDEEQLEQVAGGFLNTHYNHRAQDNRMLTLSWG